MFGIVVVLLFRINYLIISTFQNGRILFAAAFVNPTQLHHKFSSNEITVERGFWVGTFRKSENWADGVLRH